MHRIYYIVFIVGILTLVGQGCMNPEEASTEEMVDRGTDSDIESMWLMEEYGGGEVEASNVGM